MTSGFLSRGPTDKLHLPVCHFPNFFLPCQNNLYLLHKKDNKTVHFPLCIFWKAIDRTTERVLKRPGSVSHNTLDELICTKLYQMLCVPTHPETNDSRNEKRDMHNTTSKYNCKTRQNRRINDITQFARRMCFELDRYFQELTNRLFNDTWRSNIFELSAEISASLGIRQFDIFDFQRIRARVHIICSKTIPKYCNFIHRWILGPMFFL